MNKRPPQVAELLQREVSRLLLNIIPEENGLVTVTKVDITDDCRQAEIYISCFETSHKEEVLKVIKSSMGEIQSVLGKKLKMRFPPKINFKIDKSLREISRIDNIFQKIHQK